MAFPRAGIPGSHQIGPIAAAGFTACAIDVRGYNGSTRFPEVADYSMEAIVDDVAGVARALSPGVRRRCPDRPRLGAPIRSAISALIHPEIFSAVAALSVIYIGVPARSFDDVIKETFDDKNLFFYQSYFREVGRAEAVFDADPRDFLRRFYHLASGEMDLSTYPMDKDASSTLLDGLPTPPTPPAWLASADLDYYVGEFEKSGFFGPLSRYRNHTRDFNYLQAFKDRTLAQPAFFIAGDRDGAYNGFGALGDPIATMRGFVPNLEGAHVLSGCGHWTQQERPAEVNALLIPWLESLKGRAV